MKAVIRAHAEPRNAGPSLSTYPICPYFTADCYSQININLKDVKTKLCVLPSVTLALFSPVPCCDVQYIHPPCLESC